MEEKFIENPSTITDLEQMLEGRFHHQRSQSDTSFCFTTNFNNSFFFDTSDLNIYNHPLSFSLPSPITIDVVPVVTKLDESNKQPQLVGAPFSRHLRSFSADFDFYDDLKFVDDDIDKVAKRSDNERKMGHQWHNNLMDGSSTMPFEENSKMVMMDGLEKAMVIDKLVELYLLDPKRAKRSLNQCSQSDTTFYFAENFNIFLFDIFDLDISNHPLSFLFHLSLLLVSF
ncbi:Transcription factor VIP1, partial [Mucuna pruriens]